MHLDFASPHLPQDTSTSAARAPRSSTGCSSRNTAASSCFASRTPTRRAAPTTARARSSTASSGSVSSGTRRSCIRDADLARHQRDAQRSARQRRRLPLLLHRRGARAAAQGRPSRAREALQVRSPLRSTLPEDEVERASTRACRSSSAFACPTGETSWDDLVHGTITFPNKDIAGDFIILRSDGTPIYNLAVVSDDIEMRITLVMRGDDHISNTPKQILLYRALGAPLPQFAHVPMIHGIDGKKLSKRHGATAVGDYQHVGILPERDAQLPRAARLVARQRHRGDDVPGDDRAVLAGWPVRRRRRSSTRRSSSG